MPGNRATGSCLCGEVSYAIKGNLGIFQYCNCSRCRKFTGSAFSSNLLVAPGDFEWLNGEDSVSRYELAAAKHFATCFCKKCGSSLPWLAQTGKTVVVPAGTLDSDPQIKPIQNIYCASRAVWYQDPAELPSYDELPIKKKQVPPHKFISVAESTGQINPIGDYVIETVFREFKEIQSIWQSLRVSVNVSVKQLLRNDFHSYLNSKSAEYGISPSRLVVEITESLFIEDFDQIQTLLTEIRNDGYTIALDDFGICAGCEPYFQGAAIRDL